MWRPENWHNPYFAEADFGLGKQAIYGWGFPIFEDGADTMLSEIRKMGIVIRGDEIPDYLIYPNPYKGGRLVFIPDEVKDEERIS